MTRQIQIPKWLFALLAMGSITALALSTANFVTGNDLSRSDQSNSFPPLVDPEAFRQAADISNAFRQAADVIGPSVVSITSEKYIRVSGSVRGFGGVPDEFRRFFGDDFDRFFDSRTPDRQGVQRGFGTGVIVSKDGYILTNNHVVEGADRVIVKLHNEDEHDAEVIGTDEKTDLAVLQIDADNLRAAVLADSDAARVGDWVIAVGGPFGLEKTVTAGIISATSRDAVGIADYENFIQTDAAINPGNSGGPLVNLRGEVVGINTAIATRSGSNSGIGFAIPSNMAKLVKEDLIDDGRVERGWLGGLIQNLTRDLADSFGYSGRDGVLIGDVTDGGPAHKAGLKPGDIVIRFDGKVMKNASQLRNTVAATHPDSEVELEIFRDGRKQTLKVRIGLLDDKVVLSGDANRSTSTDLGLTVQTLTPELSRQLGYDNDQRGVAVTEVAPGGLAAQAGLRPGMIIVSVNGIETGNVHNFREVLADADLTKGLRLHVKADGLSRFLILRSR